MGVFNLNSDETASRQEEIQNNDVPNVVNTNTSQQVTQEVPKKEDKQEAKVILDGPLSQIYTQALNLVYAKEDTGQMLAQFIQQQDNKEANDAAADKDIYVYCCDGDDLSQDHLIESTNKLQAALGQDKYKDTILAIECRQGHVNDKVGLLDTMARSMGVRVYLTRGSALEGVKTALESLS